MFTEDLYYMYVILQGSGSLSCIRVIKYYIHNSLWEQQPWMSEIPQLERFNKKQVPRNDQFLFIMYLFLFFFSSSLKGIPHNWCRRTMTKTILQWTPTELGGVPGKMDEYFHWGPILYVCNSARNWVLVMYNGNYILYT